MSSSGEKSRGCPQPSFFEIPFSLLLETGRDCDRLLLDKLVFLSAVFDAAVKGFKGRRLYCLRPFLTFQGFLYHNPPLVLCMARESREKSVS